MGDTKLRLITAARHIFALHGYDGLSMRVLARETGVNLSSIYHYFDDKDLLLHFVFNYTRRQLGKQRRLLPSRRTAKQALFDRIYFQFEHIEEIVFILKYYQHYRKRFTKQHSGYVPESAYRHILEILELGLETKEFQISPKKLIDEAKIITHAINGFLIEYFPTPPVGKQKTALVGAIHGFVYRSLTIKDVAYVK